MAQRQSEARQVGVGLQYHISTRAGGTTEESQKAVAALTSRYQSRLLKESKRAARGEQVLRERRKAIEEVIGVRNLRRFRDFSRRQRQTAYGLKDFRPSAGSNILDEARMVAREKSLRMMARANVDVPTLRRVQDTAAKRFLNVTRPGSSRLPPTDVIPVDDPVFQSLPFVRKPPFDNWFEAITDLYSPGGTLEKHHNVEAFENPFTVASGQIGHRSTYENQDAGDSDHLFFGWRTGVGFWYTPPHAGTRQVWVKIACKIARADGWVANEFGWSDSWSNFFSRIELDIPQLPGLQGETPDWWRHHEGDPEFEWFHEEWLPPQAEFAVPFNVNFPAGPVLIFVVANDYRNCMMDDMSTEQTMRTKYQVQEVRIEG